MCSSYELRVWKAVFETYHQVEYANERSSHLTLEVKLQGRDVITFSQEQLDDELYRFNGNPREVASYFLRRHGVIVYYQDTLVGFFDIQGYKSFLDSSEFDECIRRLEPFIHSLAISDTDMQGLKLDHWILSDSIVVVIDTNRSSLNLQSLQLFFYKCSQIMATAMENGFPLRGAIGGGDFYKDAELMVSTALVDAAKYEKVQNWLGAVITPTAFKLMEQARERADDEMPIAPSCGSFPRQIRDGNIPWKPCKENEAKLIKLPSMYYIKPCMANDNWRNHLPDYFKIDDKVSNSDILYSVE